MTFAIKKCSPWFGEDSSSDKDAVYLFDFSSGLTREVGLGRGGAHIVITKSDIKLLNIQSFISLIDMH